VRLSFSHETPMAIVALMVCLPVAGGLAYIIAYSLADLVGGIVDLFQHPERHRVAIAWIVFYLLWFGWILLRKPTATDLLEEG